MNQYKIIRCLLSESTRMTFLAIQKRDTNTEKIIKEYQIPQVSCYRAIKQLKSVGLCMVKCTIKSKSGKKIKVWTTPFKSLSINLNNGKLEIQITPLCNSVRV